MPGGAGRGQLDLVGPYQACAFEVDHVTRTQVPFEQHLAGAALERAEIGRLRPQDRLLVAQADQVAGVSELFLAFEVHHQAGDCGVPTGAVGTGQAGYHVNQPPRPLPGRADHGGAEQA
jgi:hypothetical protein